MSIIKKSTLGLFLGVFALASLMSLPAKAETNPFETSDVVSSFANQDESHKCGEGKKKGKCGEGKCGEGKKKGKCGEGKCGEGKKKGKCGEGKCGEGKAKKGKCGEGKCGEGKAKKGKCGEGKDKTKKCGG